MLPATLRVAALPLENWRFPFYRIAAERDEVRSSKSGLFWDDMGEAGAFDSSLWPDTDAYASNHFTLEPALVSRLCDEPYVTGKRYNVHGDLLTDFRVKRLTVRNVLDVDQSYQSDPHYPWHSERFAAGRIEEAYLQYEGAYGFARLGRLNRSWGPFPDRSILLSNNPWSYDGFEWQVHTSFLEFRHFFSAFPRAHSDLDAGPATRQYNRYLTAHALNFMIGKWMSLGISETVLFSRDTGFPDLQYVNPFSVYSVINTNWEGDGNLMIGFQALIHPFFENVTLKGQVVFDDIQVDTGVGNEEPMHWACDLGAYYKDMLPLSLPHHLALEYRYLSKWMYTVDSINTMDRAQTYTYLGKSLGYPDVDGDELRISFTLLGKNYWAACAGIGLSRRDTNTVTTLWTSPSEPPGRRDLGYTDEPPLSKRKTVEKTISVFLEAHGYFRDFCALHVGLDNRWIRNRDTAGGDDVVFDPRLELVISCHYSNFFLKFDR